MNNYKNLSIDEINHEFTVACENGDLKTVKYLLTTPKLKTHAYIHTEDYYGLRIACQNGYLEIVKYLLTSRDLTEHANIHVRDDFCLRHACANGHLDIVDYLLTSPEITATGETHANIHANKDCALKWACESEHLDIVQYLVFERNIPLTTEISEFLNNEFNDNPLGGENVLKLFSTRDSYNNLKSTLPDKSTVTSKKIKL